MKSKAETAPHASEDKSPDGIQVRGLNRDAVFRLKQAVMDYGGPTKVAEVAEIPLSTLNSAIAGRNEPKIGLVALIARTVGVSLDWIISGIAVAHGTASQSPSPAPGTPDGDTVSVPFYNVRASAGPGAMPLDEEPTSTFAIDREFLRRLGVTATDLAVLTVHGDSAEPSLHEGDAILVDRAYRELRDGGLYVIGVDDDIVLKRVQRQMDRSIVLKSDNPAYEPQHVAVADLERLRVVGRVRWAIRGF